MSQYPQSDRRSNVTCLGFQSSSYRGSRSLPFSVHGVCNFFFVPLSLASGRRPMLIICTCLMVGSVIWAAKSTTFGSHLGA
jgi:hypothetical protein